MGTQYFYASEDRLPKGVAWFDVECVKTPISHPDWEMRSRTVPVMVGVIVCDREGGISWFQTETEEETIALLQMLVDDGIELRYSATRSYDELVVTGRWTYACRGAAERPGPWKAVVGGTFWNIRKYEKHIGFEREFDISSKDILEAWGKPEYMDAIRLHNLRDVLLLVLSDPMCRISVNSYYRVKHIVEGDQE